MVIAVDFDNTICDMSNVPKGYKMGMPIMGALQAIKRLIELGHRPIVFTVRGNTMQGTKAVTDWLEYFKFPPMSVTAVKPNADVYLDDKAVRFVNWSQALAALNG